MSGELLMRRACAPAVAIALTIAIIGCGSDRGASPSPARPAADAPLFVDVTEARGLPAPRPGWPDGAYQLPELNGPGVAFLDYDGDGDLDVLQPRLASPDDLDAPAPDRLWRQEPDGSFRDVSAAAGIGEPGYSQGVTVGDIDNDGDPDVYFTNYGPDALYRNNGDGTFTDVTAAAGVAHDQWSSSAVFCDYDGDGDQDLLVAHYVWYDPAMTCGGPSGVPDYCGPSNFDGVPDTLFRNEGNGSFRDVTAAAGLVLPNNARTAKGLGVLCTDLTGDGLPDFYVANDGEPNNLWVNRGDGTFREQALLRGVAVNRHGEAEASMGVALGDVDGDGHAELFMTHLTDETNTLYSPTGPTMFADRSVESGLSAYDRAFTGFGCGFLDYDLDGDPDLAVVNGRVKRGPVLPAAKLGEFWNPYAEPNQLFENRGDGTYADASARAAPFSAPVEITRGLAFGDVDRDGDLDMVLSNWDNSLRLLLNEAPRAGHWLSVEARTQGREALGAQVRVAGGGRTFIGFVMASYSFASSNEPRAHFGLGPVERVDSIEVLWMDGRREVFPGGPVDRVVTLLQGEGRPR